jgi:large conductance mechanosensitive channel
MQASSTMLKESKLLSEFKAFILRGNVVDLAVGVVIGAAFGTVVRSLVRNIITPLTGVVGTPDFSTLAIDVGKSTIRYGTFINDALSFLLIAASVFFFVVKPVNKLMALRKTEREVAGMNRDCPECLSSIPMAARRCAFCGVELS